MIPSAPNEKAEKRRAESVALADLWTRIQRFCTERGWDAYLYVREDRDQFGRVGVMVYQDRGYSFRAFGTTANMAIRQIAKQLERDGFDVPEKEA